MVIKLTEDERHILVSALGLVESETCGTQTWKEQGPAVLALSSRLEALKPCRKCKGANQVEVQFTFAGVPCSEMRACPECCR